jgi:hypothetical protein
MALVKEALAGWVMRAGQSSMAAAMARGADLIVSEVLVSI